MITKRTFVKLLSALPMPSFSDSYPLVFDVPKELSDFREVNLPKKRIEINSTLCRRINENKINSVSEFFKNIKLVHASSLFQKIPEELAWWLSLNKEINVIDTAVAIHEASHFMNSIISNCNGYKSYFFKNKIIVGKMKINYYKFPLINHGQAILNNLKNIDHHFYFENYIGRYNHNTIYTLIDELNSYVATSEFESAVSNEKCGNFFLDKEIKFSGNIFAAPVIACYVLLIINEIKRVGSLNELVFLEDQLVLAHVNSLIEDILNLYKYSVNKTGIKYNELACVELEKIYNSNHLV